MNIDTLIVNGCSHAYGDGAQCDEEMFDLYFPNIQQAVEDLKTDADEFFTKYTEPYLDNSQTNWKKLTDDFTTLPRWTNLLDYRVFNIGQNGSNIETDYENIQQFEFGDTGNTVYLLLIGHIHRGGVDVYLDTLQKHQQFAEQMGWQFYVLPLDYEEFVAFDMLNHKYFSSIMQHNNILSKTEYKDYWQVIADKPNFPIVDYYFNLLQCEMLKDKLIAPCRHANQKGQKIFAKRIQEIINGI